MMDQEAVLAALRDELTCELWCAWDALQGIASLSGLDEFV